MPKTTSILAPRVGPIVLTGLDDVDIDALTAGGDVENARFRGGDLSGRDLTGLTVRECEFVSVNAHDVQLRGATLIETLVERLEAPVLRAPRMTLRDVTISGSRIGSAEFYDNEWQSVNFTNCKLGFVNLRGSTVRDVLFTDCTIEELDLGNINAERVAFERTDVRVLDATGAKLAHVDLRGLEFGVINGLAGLKGATVDGRQASALSSLFANELGISVVD